MFRRALSDHENSQPSGDSVPSSQNNPAYKPPRLQQQTLHHPSHYAPSNVLRPSPASTVNSASSRPLPANGSVKRTSSGLTKFLTPIASDGFSDQIAPPSTMPAKAIHTKHETILIDEDDFDSGPDSDLEITQPASKAKVAYPSLPSSPPKPSITSFAYPTLQKADMHTQSVVQPVSHPVESMNSSNPIDWSSSPAAHKNTPPARKLNRDIRDSLKTASSTRQSDSTPRSANGQPEPVLTNNASDSSSGSSPLERPAKTRTLPWLAGVKQERDAALKVDGQRGSSASGVSKTPAGKSSAASFPWNTSYSAIKNNQKELRKFNRSKSGQDDETASRTILEKNRKATSRLALSSEQRHILDLVTEENKSVFFTGSAGTGKSVLLREIIFFLRKKYAKEPDRVAVTASTGLAACNIGGVTLHSFAGIGLGKEEVPELVKKIKRNQKAKQRWMRTKVLIVDEVSMVDGELFDKLENIARMIRNNGRPFGGIQIVITGDFFQLPPVPDSGRVARFCFDANTWNTAVNYTIGLHQVFRQKDPEFARMLNEMREGRLSQSSINAFRALSREPKYDDELQTTELFPTRAEVEAANSARMGNLFGTSYTFEARDGGTIVDTAQRGRLLANCMAPELLQLKKGSQVMLIKNIDEQLVNGSLGTVRGFMSENMWDAYEPDPEAFEHLSAAKTEDLDAAQLKKKRTMHLAASTGQLFPLVRFKLSDGTFRDLLCNRESWKIELPNGEVQASRLQVPLILAWALSIHKAQGQTMERVKVDLGKIFERGQAYVALSRATTMNGLQVLRFDPKKVQAHEKVRSFYASLSRAEVAQDMDEG